MNRSNKRNNLFHIKWMSKISIAILLSFSFCSYAQHTIPPPPIKSAKKISNKNLSYKPILLKKRLAKFPFKNASKVDIISFNLEADRQLDVPILISKDSLVKDDEKISNVVFIELATLIAQKNLGGINQRKTLTLSSTNKLTDILYNTCSKYSIYSYYQSGCYNPRNAILFYNDSGEIFEYLEICFECNQMLAEPQKIDGLQDYCNNTYTALKAFFTQNGMETQKRTKNEP